MTVGQYLKTHQDIGLLLQLRNAAKDAGIDAKSDGREFLPVYWVEFDVNLPRQYIIDRAARDLEETEKQILKRVRAAGSQIKSADPALEDRATEKE